MALVSICIPTYKQIEYLQKCIQSILEQDFIDYELIITDDTSDDSVKLFLDLLLLDKPYIYFKNIPSLGSPANWNKAISLANGKYIKIMHHDDFFTNSNSLTKMVNEIERQEAFFLFCKTDVWHVNLNIHHIHKISKKQLNITKNKPEFLYFRNMIGAPSATIYRNTKNNIFDEQLKWLVDVDFYMQLLFEKKKCVFLNETLITTAHSAEGQVTSAVINDKEIQIKEHIILFDKIKNHIKNKKGFVEYFDYLFYKYSINSYTELELITPVVNNNKAFFETILYQLPKNRKWKWFKKRFLESRYNNYIFKLEQYI